MLKWRQRWRKMVKESQSHQNPPLRGLRSPWRNGMLWPCGSGTWSVTRVPSVGYKSWVSKELVSCPDANFNEEKSLVMWTRILRFADVLKTVSYCTIINWLCCHITMNRGWRLFLATKYLDSSSCPDYFSSACGKIVWYQDYLHSSAAISLVAPAANSKILACAIRPFSL